MRRYGAGVLMFVAVTALALSAGWVAGEIQPAHKAAGVAAGPLRKYIEYFNQNLLDPWIWLLLVLGFALVVAVLATLVGSLRSHSAGERSATTVVEMTCPHCGHRLTDSKA